MIENENVLRYTCNTKGVARDKSMYMHHYSRGVRGQAPLENFDIRYRRSCML